MGYRGEDLDLRTPQTWGAGDPGGWVQGEAGRGRGYGGRAPIWVDDTVLACANHAFDVALAHRAGEVRLEHLLYALTRIEAAAETLEKRGVRVASLRRETATVIASDIPVGLPGNGSAVPRRSEAFEEALRLAAVEASRRSAPATPDDLLTVLTEIRPDLPGLALLSRHTIRVARDMPEPLSPPMVVRAPAYEPRYAEPVEPPRERVRMPAGSYYVQEPARPARTELAASTADTIQNSRIEALEQMVRALSHDLAGERKVLSGLLQDVQRDVLAQRDDAGRLGVPLLDRMQSLEAGLDKRLGDLSRTWSVLSDRLQGLENAVQTSRGTGSADLAPLGERLAGLERALAASGTDSGRQWSSTNDKLKSLEQVLAARDRSAPDLTPISDRLDVIEEALLSPDRELSRDVADRLASIERLVQSQRAEIIAETEVLKSDVASLSGLVSRSSGDADRMQQFAALVDRDRGVLVDAVTGPLLQRVQGLSSAVETRQSESATMLSQLSERLASAERALTASVQRSEESHKAYAQELAELHDALMKLNTNQHTLAGSIDQWRNHGASEMSLVAKRLEGVEREATKPLPMLEQMSASMEAMHRITVARYHRRNRFWYWLFGTDDWVAASWPSQLSKLEAERSLVKPVARRSGT